MFPLRDDRPITTPPVVTILLIVACALVFFQQKTLDDFSSNDFMARYAMVPSHFRLSTLVTSMFLHAGWIHLIGNMLSFGPSGRVSKTRWAI